MQGDQQRELLDRIGHLCDVIERQVKGNDPPTRYTPVVYWNWVAAIIGLCFLLGVVFLVLIIIPDMRELRAWHQEHPAEQPK